MNTTPDFSIQIAQELSLQQHHVANVIRLLDEGATIPFIARYRKEMTGTIVKNGAYPFSENGDIRSLLRVQN